MDNVEWKEIIICCFCLLTYVNMAPESRNNGRHFNVEHFAIKFFIFFLHTLTKINNNIFFSYLLVYYIVIILENLSKMLRYYRNIEIQVIVTKHNKNHLICEIRFFFFIVK